MKRFKNILVVADQDGFHDAVMGRAIWLAKSNAARLTLVDVMPASPGDLSSVLAGIPGVSAGEVEHEVLDFHRSRLERIAAPVRAEGIETRQILLRGVPFLEVIRQVLDADHDLVLKGVPARRRTRTPMFGSTDMHLLRKCPCPVWLIKRTRRRKYARVLAAVDPNPRDPQKDDLNRLIMDLASSLSAVDGSELHVVHAWGLEGEATIRDSAFTKITESQVDALVEQERYRRSWQLSRLLEGYLIEDRARQVHLLKGEARKLIPELAQKERVELVVMGTVARTGIRGLIIGNTAEAILDQVDCSVLAVKPADFETPVQPVQPSAAERLTVPPP